MTDPCEARRRLDDPAVRRRIGDAIRRRRAKRRRELSAFIAEIRAAERDARAASQDKREDDPS